MKAGHILATGLLMATSRSSAAVLIEIVVSDPVGVTFRSTGEAPDITTSSFLSSINFDSALSDLWIAEFGSDFFDQAYDPLQGNLLGAGSTEVINWISTGVGSEGDFSLFTLLGSENAQFNIATPAFTGSSSLVHGESSLVGGILAASEIFGPVGTVGEITVDGQRIGEYSIVPEPTTFLLNYLGASLLLLSRKRINYSNA
ncbi:MAG: hypothetical protein ACSHYB_00005 [Roseibacillus sp.]